MRVYMLKGYTLDFDGSDSDEDNTEVERDEKLLGFVRSELQAKKAVSHIAENTNIEDITYEAEEIPTDKTGLITWLNEWCFEGEDVQDLIEEVLEEY